MPLSGITTGSNVRIYSNYGHKSHNGVVADIGDWEIKLEDGTKYRNYSFRRELSLVNLDSKEYQDAVNKHDANVAITILRSKDSIEHPEILRLLKECANILGKDEVDKRSSILNSMGALNSLDKDVYEDACIDYK
jgi:hypothetical protein